MKLHTLRALAEAMSFFLFSAVHAQVHFAGKQSFPDCTDMRFADLNRDGHLDLVGYRNAVGAPTSYSLVLYLNRGTQPLAFHEITLKHENFGRGETLEIGDLDRDGDIDVLSSWTENPNMNGIYKTGWFENDGKTTSSFEYRQLQDILVQSAMIVDFNQDGWSDIVMNKGRRTGPGPLDFQIEGLAFYRNNRQKPATFNPAIIGPQIQQLFIGDFDYDGTRDITAVRSDGLRFLKAKIDRSTGAVSLEDKTLYLYAPDDIPDHNGLQISAASINGDGRMDFINPKGVFLNTLNSGTTITVKHAVDLTIFDRPGSSAVYELIPVAGDFNLDGRTDLLAEEKIGESEINLVWLENLGVPPFTYRRHSIVSKDRFSKYFVVDIDQDGDLDVVMNRIESSTSGEINYVGYWMENTGPPPDIRIETPNGADSFYPGETIPVRWTSGPASGTAVSVELWRGINPIRLIKRLTTAWNPYGHDTTLVIIPETPTGFDYRIKIVSLWDSRYFDFSDEVIKITGTPSSSVSHDLWTLYQ